MAIGECCGIANKVGKYNLVPKLPEELTVTAVVASGPPDSSGLAGVPMTGYALAVIACWACTSQC
jgi:hypothetical protein